MGTNPILSAINEKKMPRGFRSTGRLLFTDFLNCIPDIINKNPYDEGWIIKIKAKRIEDLDSLLTAEQYKKLIDE